ncbi:class I SAM-dependent methyltransferase [Salsuginibacillus kocurii]|uniref:class I SAM-dependent methyltransferase n=1 Tax=Salsuginibacillus kocurii TaxID=427078 RepID=UPI000378A103|nr:class I SAM-dependent methyltransferase [Salsuginibacillus kocurii]
MGVIVTTTRKNQEKLQNHAQALAQEFHISFIQREKTSLPYLTATYEAPVLVVGTTKLTLHFPGQEDDPFFFHPSMAELRIKALARGENDRMVEACSLQAGDTFIDATMGLGSDSLVASYVVGKTGRVYGIESHPVVAYLVAEGMKQLALTHATLHDELSRVAVNAGDHYEWLVTMEEDSADVIYFDPMFQKEVQGSSSIGPLRAFANTEEVSAATVEEACRVAKRRVVLKDHRSSDRFEVLGFTRLLRKHAHIHYGVIDLKKG